MEGNEGLRRLYEVECEAGGQMVIQSLQRWVGEWVGGWIEGWVDG